ncbi:MAG: SprB repeat-containing protein, partial [Methylococcales bacterium]
LPLMVRDFEQIVSLQFVVFWNPNELEYVGKDFSNSALPGIMSNSFGPAKADQIPASWSSGSGIPISRPDSAVLFNLCFRVKNTASGFLPLQIGGNWLTIFEVVQYNPGPVFLPLSQQIGGVSTVPVTNNNLAISSTCVENANCNQATGSISVEANGGMPAYQYSWSGPNGFSANTAAISGLAGGQYNLTVTDQAGSSVALQVEVKSGLFTTTVAPQITPAFCGQATGCANLEVGGAHPPFSFQWSAGNSQTSENCALPPGQHTVTITDAIGCESVFSIEIEDDSILQIPAKWLAIEDCNDTETITATPLNHPGPFEYLWSTGETTATLEVLTEGIYTVTVTALSGGCSSIGEFVVFDASTQSWGLELQPICDDPGNSETGNLELAFQPAGNIVFPITVVWSDGTTRLIENALAPGILDLIEGVPSGHYSVTITDAAGCSTLKETTLNCSVPPPASEHYPWFYVQGHGANPDSCAGVYAKNFEGVSALSFSLDWATYGSTLREIRNLQLPGLTLNDFNVLQGKLGLNWQTPNPVTLPVESLLFEVCLTPITGQVADPLEFSETPNLPSLVAQGESLAFLGRYGNVFYTEYQEAPPIFCRADVLPADCAADGKSRILMEACNPELDCEGSYVHIDRLGQWHNFDELSGLLFADPGTYFI